ncbi:hypothetical protein WR25_25725 [Diploscapter pachys]|uniref:TIL domain-containing protein n=1 Tax=Diploscapter pachys TaxID=2018661 RepID=A0A2A2KWE8_9BILA|nr:hypothetical protein WR25_25725 [Diploscapter pachys]
MLVPLAICFLFLVMDTKCARVEIVDRNLCAGCKMDCLGDDYGNFRCGFMTCEERDCESEGMDCKPLMHGGTKCVEKVTCDGVECNEMNEVCEVRPMENCLDDCPMTPQCVPKHSE